MSSAYDTGDELREEELLLELPSETLQVHELHLSSWISSFSATP